MSRTLRYITHPQVQIDPDVPVPEWGLSDVGIRRAVEFANLTDLKQTKIIISSAESKAVETAEVISSRINVPIEIYVKTHENDRSATGFLNPEEFETVADQFFKLPMQSVRGWERAVDVQNRIGTETIQILKKHTEGDILMVGHGAVGTLLYCHLSGLEISRTYDQPSGGGHMFAYDLDVSQIIHGWKSIEALKG